MSMPLSLRAQTVPNPRIIDDASWAKLTAAGLTLNAEDLKPYGSGRARKAGWKATYYPIEMVRAVVGVCLFGGCRVDEIRHLELHCTTWDQGTDDTTDEPSTICLLHIPQDKASRPVDPVATQLVNTRQPLPHNGLPQWLGHKHPASTRYYAAIWRGLLQLRLLRRVPAPAGLRPLPVLRPRTVCSGPPPGRQERHRPDTRTTGSHRQRT
ncbi:hypothetical protein ACIREM_42705 [Streptomyces shenzhenensis]|uniref:hypothetical protein n=1 Tax=Streptomyces shenzhenensis TaxID=943815 RepID=UPI0038187546